MYTKVQWHLQYTQEPCRYLIHDTLIHVYFIHAHAHMLYDYADCNNTDVYRHCNTYTHVHSPVQLYLYRNTKYMYMY